MEGVTTLGGDHGNVGANSLKPSLHFPEFHPSFCNIMTCNVTSLIFFLFRIEKTTIYLLNNEVPGRFGEYTESNYQPLAKTNGINIGGDGERGRE